MVIIFWFLLSLYVPIFIKIPHRSFCLWFVLVLQVIKVHNYLSCLCLSSFLFFSFFSAKIILTEQGFNITNIPHEPPSLCLIDVCMLCSYFHWILSIIYFFLICSISHSSFNIVFLKTKCLCISCNFLVLISSFILWWSDRIQAIILVFVLAEFFYVLICNQYWRKFHVLKKIIYIL